MFTSTVQRALLPRISKRRWWLALQHRFREPSLTLLVTLQVLAIFIATPLAAMHVLPAIFIGLLNAAIVFVVLAVTSKDRRAQILILAAVAINVASWLFRQTEPKAIGVPLDLATIIMFFTVLSVVLLRAVFTDEQDGTSHRILGGVAVYLNIALIFALLFRMAEFFNPHAFVMHAGPSGEELSQYIYFSFSTLTTTGFGDIIPVDPLVRSAANLESVIGALFPATLLARLVVRYFV